MSRDMRTKSDIEHYLNDITASPNFIGSINHLSSLKQGDVFIDKNREIKMATGNHVLTLSSICEPDDALITTVAPLPSQSTSYTYQYNFSNDNFVTVELNLRDGSKVIDRFDKNLIYDIRSHQDPLISSKSYSSFRYMQSEGKRDYENDQMYEVACSISDLCYLLKINYVPFYKTLVEKAIRGDEK